MITREDIRELAEFQGDGADRAISFYFQPAPPSNRVASRSGDSGQGPGSSGPARGREERHGTGAPGLTCKGSSTWREIGREAGTRAKAVFACGSRKIWREFDLPPQLAKTQLFVNRRFHLKELAVLLGGQPRLWVAFVDRHRARFFDLHLDEVKEQEALFRPLPRRGRGDGFAGLRCRPRRTQRK